MAAAATATVPDIPYKETKPEEERIAEAAKIRSKFPDRVPVICERAATAKAGLPQIENRKFLVPEEMTMGQLVYIVRKRIKLPAEQAIFVFVNGKLPATSAKLADLYRRHKDADGMLYCAYASENTFG
ncbi:hypothetical protein FNF27_05642 [Cafeteria roenbergensis]|uniref:Autophagy-related protein n=1 Tax=Cafeteria roenbergensis TaxID=33653 RepID=A0A5A8E7S8_CAFRO|nr:hypothetical protein FNF29_04815 [Cafeteria roenbergensis]KAA0164873.1 hypothetical protein FNF31_02195 [Cafeteria roenbergensis]KAA0167247.1 hypothetical protein FNF28_02897 [Cafeteria roenbergensis]KAA0172887.1 hypothetical protein FNF27_05642 [Cafeteria roenbergensis]|eukprot:KAA0151124.1 hypothetical protein FNF29_04815 [Cafeteria roenbergensis]